MSKLKFTIAFTCLYCVFAALAAAQIAPPDDDRPEKILTEEIALNVSAFDRQGRFAADLRKEDLVIVENDRLFQPTSVRRVPANVLVLLDTSGEIVYGKSTSVTRETAKSLVSALRPEDRLAVMQYNDRVETIAGWTSEKASVLDALDRKMGFGRRSVFYEALSTARRYFEETPRENRHLVVITDGVDTFDEQKAKEAALNQLIASEINVHVISYTFLQQVVIEPKRRLRLDGEPAPRRLPEAGLLGLPENNRKGKKAEVSQRQIAKMPRLSSLNLDREMRRRLKQDLARLETAETLLKTIAEDANGELFLPLSYEEMIANAEFLAETIDSQYVVTYAPRLTLGDAAAGEVRRIEVSSKREGLRAVGKRKLVLVKN